MDGPLPKLCPAVALSRQDGHHSAVVLLLKAALIQVSDYRLLGASGFVCFFFFNCGEDSEIMIHMKKYLIYMHSKYKMYYEGRIRHALLNFFVAMARIKYIHFK